MSGLVGCSEFLQKSKREAEKNTKLGIKNIHFIGMMTGQILSGAVRYQIMVMAMVFGSSGMSVIIYLALILHRSAVQAY